MIETLKLVLGAVSSKDIVPVLNNFCLYKSMFDAKGRIQGANGTCYIDAPFDHPIQECTVAASRFVKAIEACGGQVPTFGITEGGKLSIKSGKFKAYLATLPAIDYPRASQEGTMIEVDSRFLETLIKLKPFISEDASRVWSTALLLTEDYAYATNNIIVARAPLLWCDQEIAIPAATIDRLIDMDMNPTACYLADTSITFEYGEVWLRTQIKTEPWPAVANMFDVAATEPLPDGFAKTIEALKHFCTDEKFPVINLGTEVKTDEGEHGASFEGFTFPEASFHADQLLKVLSVATHVNFSSYPKPCQFKGLGIEGLLVGVRK